MENHRAIMEPTEIDVKRARHNQNDEAKTSATLSLIDQQSSLDVSPSDVLSSIDELVLHGEHT